MGALSRWLARWPVVGGASRRPIAVGYAVSVVSVALAVVVSSRFADALRGGPFTLLLLAVAVSAWLGGPGPGILAALLGVVSFDYLLTQPPFTELLGPWGVPFRLVIYVVVTVVVVLLSNAERLALAKSDEERRRLQQILDVLPQSVLLLDRRGQCVHANAAAQQSLGLTVVVSGQKAKGCSLSRLGFRDGDGRPLGEAELPFVKTATLGKPSESELLVVPQTSAGGDLAVLASSAALFDRKGELAGAVAILQDIRALRDLEIQKEEFLAAVAHDLRNPLTNIRGYTQLLLSKASADGGVGRVAVSSGLDRIDRAAAQLATMIDEFVDVGRLQMNRPPDLDRRWTDLAALTRGVVEEYRQANPRRRFVLEGRRGPLRGEWDDARLRRILGNLLSNAVKYSPPDTPIRLELAVRTDNAGRWATVTIRDQGIGIPASDLPHIFERFHRGANVRNRVVGTGIGLAGARWLARQHGGDLTVESREGQGSAFMLRLPLALTSDEGE